MQINKNSKNIGNNKSMENADVEEIQLSPKKNKGESQIRKSDAEEPIDTSGAELLNDSMRKG